MPATILFVIDRSGSMNCNPPPTQTTAQCEAIPVPANAGLPTKWKIVRDAFKTAIAQLPAGTQAGIVYFNTDDDCGIVQTPQVPIALLDAAKLTAVNTSLDGVNPKGSTPLVGATTYAYEHLRTSTIPGKKFVLLLTDGAETCDPAFKPRFLSEILPLSRQYQFRTFVLGAPGSEPDRAFLSSVANAGGTARAGCNPTNPTTPSQSCHFDMTDPTIDFATELPKALDEVSREALSCDFAVPQPPPGQTIDYGKVNVSFTPRGGATTPVLHDTTKPCNAGADGWVYSPDLTKIILCGPACAAVKADPASRVSITLGCTTESRPIPR